MGVLYISRGQCSQDKRRYCIIHRFWTDLCLDWLISVKPLVMDKDRFSTSFLSDKESDIVLTRNLTGFKESDLVLNRNLTDFSVIGGIKYMLLLTLTDNALSFKIFSLTNMIWKVLQTFLPRITLKQLSRI